MGLREVSGGFKMFGLFFGEESGEGNNIGIDLLCGHGRDVTVCLSHDFRFDLAGKGQETMWRVYGEE